MNTDNRQYTLEEMTKYFGVSRDTILDWVKDNRFVGMEIKDSDKDNIMFSSDLKWKHRNGDILTIADIVNMYEEGDVVSPEEYIESVKNSIEFFENKYSNTFDEFKKNVFSENRKLSDMEKSDMCEWNYLMDVLKKIE